MTYTTSQLLIFIGIIAVTTFFTRVIPFLLFPEKREIPKFMKYLAEVLPYTIIGLLVVYCLKDVSITQMPYGLPELISIAYIILIHLWKKSTLLSIGSGTLLYMLLIQFAFK